MRALRSSNSAHVRELSACVMATWSGTASAIDSHTVAKCISIGQIVGHSLVPIVTQRIVGGPESQEWVYLLKQGLVRRRTPVMGATSWQHIRTFSGDVERTLEQLRSDVFASGAFYLCDEPVLIGARGARHARDRAHASGDDRRRTRAQRSGGHPLGSRHHRGRRQATEVGRAVTACARGSPSSASETPGPRCSRC